MKDNSDKTDRTVFSKSFHIIYRLTTGSDKASELNISVGRYQRMPRSCEAEGYCFDDLG